MARDPGAEIDGGKLFKARCVRCHGALGQGSEDAPRPLTGDRTVPQLSKLIQETMPPDDPGSCTPEESKALAAYIQDAFYSKIAQARLKPPRIELARLTVPQYRLAVADIFAELGKVQPIEVNGKLGLQGEYFKGNKYRDADRRLVRRDPNIDFGESTPLPDQIPSHELSVRWTGSIYADRTGDYEFIVRTEHSVALFVNGMRRPLIDATVKSGKANETEEFKDSIRLIGGRYYAISLTFSKAVLGEVKNSKPTDVKGGVKLLWTPPGGTTEVVPEAVLSPKSYGETLVLKTPFPADDRSNGYEKGTTISKAWQQATIEGAIEAAEFVIENRAGLGHDGHGVWRSLDDDPRCFCLRLAELAFRRPLTESDRRLYIETQFKTGEEVGDSVRRSVMAIMLSPRFLYREIGGDPADSHALASRLSFAAWDSIPDAGLREAASCGGLSSREQVERQAERMLADPRAHVKVREFFMHWLRLEHAPQINKDPKEFPGFDRAVVADLRRSLELFIDDVVWGASPDFRRLLTANYLFMNGRLAAFYGSERRPEGTEFEQIGFEPEEHAGLISHPYILATFSYRTTSSPIHRGVFLARGILGRLLKPPPVAVAPLPADLHAGLTTRERVAIQTSPTSCNTCHSVINPLGFALEKFDAIGRVRSFENQKPIDASGSYQTLQGETVRFTGAKELAEFLCTSDEVRTAFVEQLFHHLNKQPIRAYGTDMAAKLKLDWIENGYNVRRLIVNTLAWSCLAESANGSKGRP